jgi:hypothetical protein
MVKENGRSSRHSSTGDCPTPAPRLSSAPTHNKLNRSICLGFIPDMPLHRKRRFYFTPASAPVAVHLRRCYSLVLSYISHNEGRSWWLPKSPAVDIKLADVSRDRCFSADVCFHTEFMIKRPKSILATSEFCQRFMEKEPLMPVAVIYNWATGGCSVGMVFIVRESVFLKPSVRINTYSPQQLPESAGKE